MAAAPEFHDETTIINVDMGTGKRIVLADCDGISSDVDLYVKDRNNGQVVAADVRIDANCFVTFVAPHDGDYEVFVINLGPGSNRSHVEVH